MHTFRSLPISVAASLLAFWMIVPLNAFFAQYAHHPLPQYPEAWNSRWITHPDIDETAHNLIHFRNTFALEDVPDTLLIHVSGDNRYRLYVNEKQVGYGPQLGDMRHWRYETYNIAAFLKSGENIIAAEVINWGVERSYGIISFKTGFLVQSHTAEHDFLSTGSGNWNVLHNQGLYEKPVYWMTGGEIVGGFYAANPTDSIVAAQYPWGWKALGFDDSQWLSPEHIFSKPKTNAGAGHGWILQPRTTAMQVDTKELFTRVARSSRTDLAADFQFGQQPLIIPPHSQQTFLIDQGYVTLGYPKLQLSQGQDAEIRIKYSEALYDENNQKGHRNELAGKVVKGISDVIVMDGGDNRVFQPLWLRTFRFIELRVQTQEEPLVVDDFFNIFSASPFSAKAAFETSDSLYNAIWDICWHGLKICAQANLLSDAYYEQMQYVGDLRPHLKAWVSLTGDLTYFRSAMEQFNNSRLPDGNITSCYPLKATFVHPTYSLIWIDMLHDLMLLEGDKKLLDSYTVEIQEVFDYYESLINENGLVGKSKYKMFIDWYVPKGGNSPVNDEGNSAILTLNYAYTLDKAADILQWLGYRDKSSFYRNQSRKYAEVVRKLCFDTEKGIYADDPEQTFYDQRASILAVLTSAHSEAEAKVLMEKILDEETPFDSKANLFYLFYFFEVMEKTGVGNFTEELQPWHDILAMGMTATPEKRIEQHPRSEVHPWTAHPVHYFFSLAAGIRPTSPGFNTVRIAPQPGELEFIQATYPTIHGVISVDLNFEKTDKVSGAIILPEGMSGEFVWRGEILNLTSGKNSLK